MSNCQPTPLPSDPHPPEALDVAIVGGGVSGALTALHLRRGGGTGRIVVFDPRPTLGLGLAYSTPSLRHLLNVPAGKISALPEEPDHFLQWLRAHQDANADAETFAPRAVFGQYIQSLMHTVPAVEHVNVTIVDGRLEDGRAILTADNGKKFTADRVVLATGNFDPAPLHGVDVAAIATGAYRHNAWATGTYEDLDPAAAVTLVGTGLTAVDVLLRLREQGHHGIITALSRHGVFPNRHKEHPALPEPAIERDTPANCLAYLRAVRKAIRTGKPWRSAVDSLREVTNPLWLRLPVSEQQRFRRHLQRRWDVVRHRTAPTIADALEAELRHGTLVVRRGHLVGVTARDRDASVEISRSAGVTRYDTGRVINCTGPSMDYRRAGSGLLDALFAGGWISSGPLGGGLRCDDRGAVLDAAGRPSPVLFNIGPGRLGTLLESIAVPELRQQAAALATHLVHA